MSEHTPSTDSHGNQPEIDADDPDRDPENLSPRDDREQTDYDGDPDADPGNMNPREG